jgi:5-methylcytosine-specific restriction enzyme A
MPSIFIRGKTLTDQDILKAMADFDDQYSETNDYENWLNRSTYRYALVHDGNLYPPKYILGYASDVERNRFNGGVQYTNQLLTELGFEIIEKPGLSINTTFEIGESYKRTDLHNQYGGQSQGGISTPANHNFIMLFTGDSGEQHGYVDSWVDGIFHYTGEGQSGDMEFIRGNLAIKEHLNNSKDLHLFENTDSGYVRYIGQMICTGYHHRDDLERRRQVIVFELAPVNASEEETPPNTEDISKKLSLDELRQRALMSSREATTAVERKTIARLRSQAIVLYAKKRAKGKCEGCKQDAPFKNNKGEPFLEVHHVNRLADGGPDHPAAVVAICPNCHRRAHHSRDAETFNSDLRQIAQLLEANA